MAGSGWNPNSEEVQRFSLPSQQAREALQSRRSVEPAAIILLVEDSAADALLVREALEEHGVVCELVVIANGERALKFIADLDAGSLPCPDLAIIDLNLPKKPGREVLQAMRSSVRCKDVPIIVLTSSDNQRDKEDAARFGASRYFRKPSQLAEFMKLGAVFKDILHSPG